MKIRNKNENTKFNRHIATAIDEIQQAIDSITYTSFPEINRRTIATLEKAINILKNVSKNCIFKP